jgi:endonuclease III
MKRPFDIDLVMSRIGEVVRPFPQAALFELAEEGFRSPFEILIACIVSIRTLDEVTLPCARRLFALARTPLAMSQLSTHAIAEAIHNCTFYEAKAKQIHEIADRVEAEHAGILPCDSEQLRSLRGVGPKCAHLVLGIACQQPYIGVDIHVHRVTNRWGYVHAHTPERTMSALEAVLPPQYWVEINRLLVPFGKHICTRMRPRCSACPVLDMCQQVGVEASR